MKKPPTPKRMRKGQMQMGESITILLVFFFLMMIAVIFYVKILKSNAIIQKEENVQLESISISEKALALPELSCSRQNIVTESCIDILKLTSASPLMLSHQEHYFDILGFSNITVTQVYPSYQTYPLYSSPLETYNSKETTRTPISLFDPITNAKSFGILTIEAYSR